MTSAGRSGGGPCGSPPASLAPGSLGHGLGGGVLGSVRGGVDEGLPVGAEVWAVLLYMQSVCLAYFAENIACSGVMPADVALLTGQIISIAFVRAMVRSPALCAWLHIVLLVSGAGPTVLVSQEIVPRRVLSSPGRLDLAGRAGRVTSPGPCRGRMSGRSPSHVRVMYTSPLWGVVRIWAYLVMPPLLDS